MATGPDGSAPLDEKTLELRTNYWLKRLDHTLTHTQTSSRLIYIVDGAILALIYFAVQNLGTSRQIIFLMAFPTALLATLNLYHARIAVIQHEHYLAIDRKLRDLLVTGDVRFRHERQHFASTHSLYCGMHITIAAFLALTAFVMLLYGLGCFAELQTMRGASVAGI